MWLCVMQSHKKIKKPKTRHLPVMSTRRTHVVKTWVHNTSASMSAGALLNWFEEYFQSYPRFAALRNKSCLQRRGYFVWCVLINKHNASTIGHRNLRIMTPLHAFQHPTSGTWRNERSANSTPVSLPSINAQDKDVYLEVSLTDCYTNSEVLSNNLHTRIFTQYYYKWECSRKHSHVKYSHVSVWNAQTTLSQRLRDNNKC